jgi:glycosyltransferase involved in cell wall biosynthesis
MKNIHITCPINKLSYGYTSYYLIKELLKLKNNIFFYNIGPVDNDLAKDVVNIHFLNKHVGIFAKNQPYNTVSLKIWHQNEVHGMPVRGHHYGFPIFELDRFNEIEKASLKLCDELITCSKWGAKVIKEQTGKDCHVVPLGIDDEIFKPCGPSTLKNTIFFNCGKWEIRKGHDILIECFNKAFNESDNVELWLMCDNIFLQDGGKSWIDLCKKSKLSSKIRLIPRQSDHADVYRIMSKTDVGVFPSHAEGWNLELLELMAIGKHVIATDYSAHTEYCTSENSSLLNIDSLESAYDGIWFHNNGRWAEIKDETKDQMISYMRMHHKNKQDGLLGINSKGIETGKQYTWANSAKILSDLLNNDDI